MILWKNGVEVKYFYPQIWRFDSSRGGLAFLSLSLLYFSVITKEKCNFPFTLLACVKRLVFSEFYVTEQPIVGIELRRSVLNQIVSGKVLLKQLFLSL